MMILYNFFSNFEDWDTEIEDQSRDISFYQCYIFVRICRDFFLIIGILYYLENYQEKDPCIKKTISTLRVHLARRENELVL